MELTALYSENQIKPILHIVEEMQNAGGIGLYSCHCPLQG
jgi:hypothetical protein